MERSLKILKVDWKLLKEEFARPEDDIRRLYEQYIDERYLKEIILKKIRMATYKKKYAIIIDGRKLNSDEFSISDIYDRFINGANVMVNLIDVWRYFDRNYITSLKQELIHDNKEYEKWYISEYAEDICCRVINKIRSCMFNDMHIFSIETFERDVFRYLLCEYLNSMRIDEIYMFETNLTLDDMIKLSEEEVDKCELFGKITPRVKHLCDDYHEGEGDIFETLRQLRQVDRLALTVYYNYHYIPSVPKKYQSVYYSCAEFTYPDGMNREERKAARKYFYEIEDKRYEEIRRLNDIYELKEIPVTLNKR